MKNKDYNFHTTEPEHHKKGWGYELWLTNNEKYCGKILHFEKNKKCSFHYHKKKTEHFYVLKGDFIIKLSWDDDCDNAEELVVYPGDVIEIPVGLRHQMFALTEGELIEISTEHFEDDSYRIVKGD